MAFKNKRSVERYPLFGRCTVIMPDKNEVIAHIANISIWGIGLYTVMPVDELAQVTVKINFRDTSSNEQECFIKGIVYWAIKKEEIYQIGIRFTEEITSESQTLLYNHINEIAKLSSIVSNPR